MRLPILDEDSARIDEPESIKQIRYAIDGGFNYIDIAYPYHQGNSKSLVAKALEDGYREKVKIAAKCPSWLIKTREDMDRYLNEQLENLSTDHIDYYLLRTMNKKYWDNYLECDVFDFIGKALADGRIRNIGFSFHDRLNLFKEILDSYDWAFCQIQYNVVDEEYQAGREGLDYAYAKGIPVVVMEPLRGGSLVSRIPEDIQSIWDSLSGDFSPAAWCLHHIWDHLGVSLLLSGMNEMVHIEENLKEADLARPNSLSAEIKGKLAQVREIYLSRMKVRCTDCGYCMPRNCTKISYRRTNGPSIARNAANVRRPVSRELIFRNGLRMSRLPLRNDSIGSISGRDIFSSVFFCIGV